MKTSSAKSKGRKLQQHVVRELRKAYNLDTNIDSCYDGNVQSIPMGCSGEDIKFSPYAKTLIPFSIETKNNESLAIWKALTQCEENTKEGQVPLLIFKRNRSKVYATLELSNLLFLLTGYDGKKSKDKNVQEQQDCT